MDDGFCYFADYLSGGFGYLLFHRLDSSYFKNEEILVKRVLRAYNCFMNKQCEHCKQELITNRKNKRFCSDKCIWRARSLKYRKEIKIKRAKRYQENIEQEKHNNKLWYQAHRESEIEKNREYRKQNKELFDWYHNKDRFSGIRHNIIKRDGGKCVVCGSFKVAVHHIDGSSITEQINNNTDNLITLCVSCHSRLHHWQRKNRFLKNPSEIIDILSR